MQRSRTDFIVVHCADTPPSMDVGAAEIRKWHVEGNGWADIGYHFVIRRNSAIEEGRPVDAIGTHVAGHNSNSVAICLVGGRKAGPGHEVAENNFTPQQFRSLALLIRTLLGRYPNAQVCGHRDFPGVTKQCPSFDVRSWWSDRAESADPASPGD